MVCVHWHHEMCAYIVCLSNGIDVCIEKHCALCMMCLLKSLRCNVLYIYICVCVCAWRIGHWVLKQGHPCVYWKVRGLYVNSMHHNHVQRNFIINSIAWTSGRLRINALKGHIEQFAYRTREGIGNPCAIANSHFCNHPHACLEHVHLR